MTEYPPGTVATAKVNGFPARVLRDSLGWAYVKGWRSDASGSVTDIRPLVVLDPENDSDVDRLIEAIREYHAHFALQDINFLRVRGALRRLSRPRKPEPPEPTETGARVVDRHGDMWVRNAGGPWICLLAPDVAMTLPWAELRAKYGPLEVKP